VGKEYAPRVAEPLVKIDRAGGGFGGKIGSFVSEADGHYIAPSIREWGMF
jgi:hypothetical protein